MENREIVSSLKPLIQLDIDAVFAYGQAIERVEEEQIRTELQRFLREHERHIDILSAKVRELGGEPPERSRDFKGFLIEGFTAMRSITGTKGALNAMETNEQLTNKTYAKHDAMEYPLDVKRLVAEFHADEKKHLTYVRQMLQLLEAKHPAEMEAGEERVFHVVAHGTDGWWVETGTTTAAKHRTKDDAVEKARQLAQSGVASRLVIHGIDGSVESEQHFGGRKS